ncbi:MAG: MATE family efflux transporter [Cellulosilyticum sp.]|nr:MATE family efflux transporter [Cellulosilyticum sp.]
MIKDMTTGSPTKTLCFFSIPMLLSVMFQQIYNIADSMIAGQYIGEDALAAVGASYPITMIFMAVAIGCNIGSSVVISQLFGAGRLKEMKTAIFTTFIVSLVISFILTVLGLLLSKGMMQLIQTPSNIFEDAKLYLQIYIGGMTFLFLYNICTGVFTALGDSRTPLYFLIGSSIGNILLDLIFVIVFKWGVAGVAWATFVAQGISCILSLVTLVRRIQNIHIDGKAVYFSWNTLFRISQIAIPSILQQSFISVGNLLIQGLINSYGSTVIAGYASAVKLNTFAITSFTTLGNGVSSFTAQNIGAGKKERVRLGFKSGYLMAIMIVIPFFIAYFFLSDTMLGLFMKEESEEALNVGKTFLKITSPFYIIISAKLIADGVLRGAGAMRQFMIATFSDLILRVMLSFILAYFWGTIGIWVSWPIGWIIGMLLSCLFYKTGTWEKVQMDSVKIQSK